MVAGYVWVLQSNGGQGGGSNVQDRGNRSAASAVLQRCRDRRRCAQGCTVSTDEVTFMLMHMLQSEAHLLYIWSDRRNST